MVRCALFVLATVFVALASAEDQAETIEKGKKLAQKCLTETGTTADNVRAFANGQTYPDGVKCMLKCFMQSNKAMKEDGTIDVDRIVSFTGEAKKANVEKCKAGATSTDLCEKAFQYESCFLANEPEFFKTTVGKILA